MSNINFLNTQKIEKIKYNEDFSDNNKNNLGYTDDVNNYKIIFVEKDKMSDCDYLSKNEDTAINHILEFPSQFLPFDNYDLNKNKEKNYNNLKEKEIKLNDYINNIDIKIDDNKILNNDIDDLNLNALNNNYI